MSRTAWSDALASSQGTRAPVALATEAGLIIERRRRVVRASPEAVYGVFTSLGGERGWLYANRLWRLRGLLDRLVGGVGLRRGRRDRRAVRVGEALDFWRVEAVEPGHLLRLRAEMKVPGRAWLQFETTPGPDTTLLVQTAVFAPKGVWGVLRVGPLVGFAPVPLRVRPATRRGCRQTRMLIRAETFRMSRSCANWRSGPHDNAASGRAGACLTRDECS
jgi:uncharacterized protein YndB with AHSA1/START domain